MKKGTKKVKSNIKVGNSAYDINLLTSGVTYKSSGETIDEALKNLNLSWEQIKAKGVLTIFKGNLKLEKLFIMGQMRKIFANKITRATWAKRLSLLLK